MEEGFEDRHVFEVPVVGPDPLAGGTNMVPSTIGWRGLTGNVTNDGLGVAGNPRSFM